MQRWRCTVCEYLYDPAEGDPVNDVPSGVSFDELLLDWKCPVCQAGKNLFEPYPDPEPGSDEL